MEPPPRKFSWAVWAGLGLTVALVVLAVVASNLQNRLHTDDRPLPVYSEAGAFTLTNQLARTVTLADLRGQVWIADIIFTRCPGPCAKMTRQMADLQAHLPASRPVKLVSLTTDPDFDQPAVLQRYAERFGAHDDRWWFLTGTKQEIARLAIGGLKLTAIEKKPEERSSDTDLFVHSTIFVVVDGQGRLRAVFETQPSELDESGQPLPGVDPTKQWTATRAKILATVERLLSENGT